LLVFGRPGVWRWQPSCSTGAWACLFHCDNSFLLRALTVSAACASVDPRDPLWVSAFACAHAASASAARAGRGQNLKWYTRP
jgi:hypothetical protein